MHAAAERGEDADAKIAEFVAAAFDDDIAIAGHAAGGGGLIFEVAQQVLGGVGIEAVFFDEAGEGGGARHGEQLARHLADLAAELGGASGAIAVPEGHLAGLAGGGGDGDAIVGDLIDAPGGGAEDDGVAGAALEDHLLIEFADARAARGAGEVDGEESAVGDGAAVDDGDGARALPRGELVGDAVPGEARAEFGELVGGVAAGEHVEHGIEDAAGEGGVGRGLADEGEERAGVPGVHGDHGDDLLGEDVERIARVVDGLHLAGVHGARDGGAGDEIAAVFGEDDGGAGAADVVAGAADALHAAGDGGRRFDLHDEIDGAHVDAEFERGRGDEAAQRAHLEAVFDFLALVGGDAAVVGAHQGVAGEFVDGAGDALGEAAAVDEDEGGGVGADEFEQLGMDGAPDGGAHGGLRGGAAGQGDEVIEARHIVERDFDAEVDALGLAGVDDGDVAVGGSGGGGFEFGEDFVGRGRRGGPFSTVGAAAAPPRKRATSSSGRCVAESPMRWSLRPQRASRRSRERARWLPRLVGTRAWISSSTTVSTERRTSRALEVSRR